MVTRGNWGGGCVLLKLSLQITSSENLAVVMETSVWLSPAPSTFCCSCCILLFQVSCLCHSSWELSGKGHRWFTCSLVQSGPLSHHSFTSQKKDWKVQMASRVSECMDFKKKWSFLLSSSLGRTLRCCGTVITVMVMILMTSYFDAL